MPTAEFFTRFGLFVCKNFLDQELGTRCCREIDGADQTKAMIARTNETDLLDEKIRKVKLAAAPDATVYIVEERLLSLIPTLDELFNFAVDGCEIPDFLT